MEPFVMNFESPEGIAYDTWVIDTITGSGARSYGTVFSNYGDNPPSVYGQNVRQTDLLLRDIQENMLFQLGGNYSNKIYFGATFGISTLRYIKSL